MGYRERLLQPHGHLNHQAIGDLMRKTPRQPLDHLHERAWQDLKCLTQLQVAVRK